MVDVNINFETCRVVLSFTNKFFGSRIDGQLNLIKKEFGYEQSDNE